MVSPCTIGQIRLRLFENRIESGDHSGRDLAERLPRLHQVQIEIRHNTECVQHLIQHAPMLGGDAYLYRKPLRLAPQTQDNRAELDRLRPRAKNDQDPVQATI